MAETARIESWELLPAGAGHDTRFAVTAAGTALYLVALGPASREAREAFGTEYQLELAPLTDKGGALLPPDRVSPIAYPLDLPSAAVCDLLAVADGSLAMATEAFGGALNALVFGRVTDDGQLDAKGALEAQDYRYPRFVRGLPEVAGRGLVATLDGEAIALIDLAAKDPASATTTLAQGERGLVLVTATQQSNGLLLPGAAALLYKTNSFLGPVAPNTVFPGELVWQGLSREKAAATPLSPLGSGRVYEFDADVLGSWILLLAGTTDGPVLLLADSAGGSLQRIPWPQGWPPAGTWIAGPAVAALPGAPELPAFAFAFIERDGERLQGVRLGLVSLPGLGPAAGG